MKCPKCQAENPATKKFCYECGASLLKVCTQCGSEILPADKFCGDCGHQLSKPKEAPSSTHATPQSYTPKYLAEKILTSRAARDDLYTAAIALMELLAAAILSTNFNFFVFLRMKSSVWLHWAAPAQPDNPSAFFSPVTTRN
jgi:predicted amidophosphoribosyltransferase